MENYYNRQMGRFAPGDLINLDILVDPYAPNPLPPVFDPNTGPLPPPIKDDGTGGGYGIYPASRIYSGNVRDSADGSPIQSATIRLYGGGQLLDQVIADKNGYFEISGDGGDTISISSAGYKPFNWPASQYQHVFELEKSVVDLPPVVLPPVTSGGKNTWIIWAGLAFIIAKEEKLI